MRIETKGEENDITQLISGAGRPVVFPNPPSAENFIFVKNPAPLSHDPTLPVTEFSISLWLYFMEERYFVGTDDRYDMINLRQSRAISCHRSCQ